MKRETFAKISAILKSMPYGTAAPFDDEIRTAYELYLKPVPEGVAARLIPAIMAAGFRFRPAPGEVLELASTIANGPKPGAIQALEEAFDKRRRLGPKAVQDGWYSVKSGGEAVLDKNGEELQVRRWVEGPPDFSDPLILRVVNILGGWVAFCGVPAAQESYLRHEFQKVYRELEGGAGGAVLRQLSSEYRTGLLEQPEAPALSEPAGYIEGEFSEAAEDDAPPNYPNRQEAAQIMGRFNRPVKQLTGSRS